MTTTHTPGKELHGLEYWQSVKAERDRLREQVRELRTALKAMQKACDEWAAEFTQKKRAMDWGVVNDAYCKASAALAKIED